jgi:integrase
MRPIKARENNGSCIIRWTFQSERYSINWGTWGSAEDRARLQICARNIYLDCLADEFDSTLNRYRSWLLGVTVNGNGNGRSVKPQVALKLLLAQRLENHYNDADAALVRLLA